MRELKFKGLYEIERTGERQWSFYGIGGAPHLIGAHWVTKDLQFIGKDGNGNDIYEDDLVLGQIWNQRIGHVMRVKLDEDTASYFPFNEVHPTAEGDESFSLSSVEVVGTFVENPKTIVAFKLGRYARGSNKETFEHDVEEF